MMRLILDPAGIPVTRVIAPFGDLPPGWTYIEDDGRSLGPPPPPPPPPPAIRNITLAAFLLRLTDPEYAAMSANPALRRVLDIQLAESGSVNLDSPRLVPLLKAAGLSDARIAELKADGTADEAA